MIKMLYWKIPQSLFFFLAATTVFAQQPQPEQIYDGHTPSGNSDSPILLRIGNGGAGQSGLIKGMLSP